MALYTCKHNLITGLPQMGKTFLVKNEIKAFNKECESKNIKPINIFLTTNNRVLTVQSSNRMPMEEEDIDDNKVVSMAQDFKTEQYIVPFAWISGNRVIQEEQKEWIGRDSPKIIAVEIFRKRCSINMLLMCSNPLRITRLKELLHEMNIFAMEYGIKYMICFWIDEADLTINCWEEMIKQHGRTPVVKQITFITATPGVLYENFPETRLVPNAKGIPSCYRGVKDADFVLCDDLLTENKLDGIEDVIRRYHLNVPGSKIFVPAYCRTNSHDEMATRLNCLGFVVIILNGKKKCIQFPGGYTLNLKPYFVTGQPAFEVSLPRIYEDNELYKRPFAITGHDLLSCGTTFMSRDFIWTSVIMTPLTKSNCNYMNQRTYEDIIYQIGGRFCGNIGDYTNHKIKVYTTEHMRNIMLSKEEEGCYYLKRSLDNPFVRSVIEEYRQHNHNPYEQKVTKPTRKKEKTGPEAKRPIIINDIEFERLQELSTTRGRRPEMVRQMIEESKCEDVENLRRLLRMGNVVMRRIFAPGIRDGKSKMETKKRYITDQIKRWQNGQSFDGVGVDPKDKSNTHLQAVIDLDHKQLIILLWCVDPELYPQP